MFIYCITNSVNGKLYVGMTSRPIVQRFAEHLSHAKRRDTALARAIVKYGAEFFSVRPLAEAKSWQALEALECRFIEELQSKTHRRGYNIADGGGKGQVGLKRSDATKQRIREANLGKRHTDASRARMSTERKLRGLSAEQQGKMQAGCATYSARFKMGWRRGKPLPIDLRRKISTANQGHVPHEAIRAAAAMHAFRMAVECGPNHRKGINLYIEPGGRSRCRACKNRARTRPPPLIEARAR